MTIPAEQLSAIIAAANYFTDRAAYHEAMGVSSEAAAFRVRAEALREAAVTFERAMATGSREAAQARVSHARQAADAAALWRDLCEKDDRTSPEEYPKMALITEVEFHCVFHEARNAALAEAAAVVRRYQGFGVGDARTIANKIAGFIEALKTV